MDNCRHFYFIIALSLLFSSCGFMRGLPKYTLVHDENQTQDYIKMDTEYPQFTGEIFRDFNHEIKTMTQEGYGRVKALSEQNAQEIIARNTPYSYTVMTYALKVSGTIISVVLLVDSYTGEAHGEKQIFSINYDYKAKQFVSITDITHRSVSSLSTICREKLYEQLLADKDTTNQEVAWLKQMIDFGTQDDNISRYSTFALDGNTVIIYFAPYAVAPYVYGVQSVEFKK